MNNLFRIALAALLMTAAACTQPAPLKPSPVLGLLEVNISLDGTARAQFVSGQGQVSAQTNTVVSDVGINFTRQFVNFYDDDVKSVRYINAVFGITNTTGINFGNLTLYAVNVPTNIGGTAIAAMATGDGLAVPGAVAVAQGMKPTHGMRTTSQGLEVDPNRADLHVINQTEATTIQTGAAGLNPPIVGNVLQYGFVARNQSGGRSIGNSSCGGTNCNKGVVTFAYKLPKVNPRKDNPFTFSLYFVVANESDTIVTQSVEEQDNSLPLVLRKNNLGAATQVRVLAGSSYTGTATRFCQVRTAGTNATPLASLIPQNLVDIEGACGNNPALLAAINTARATGRNCGGTFYPAAPALVWNLKLGKATNNHSLEMAQVNSYQTITPIFIQVIESLYQGNWQQLVHNGPTTVQSVLNDWLADPFACSRVMTIGWTNMAMAAKASPTTGVLWWTLIMGDGG